ncbi:glycosyltransferase [Amycolatopsis saalfeldensis]|uniref:UDP:flavonoid glycosyltransferase YjiC, YdhE family n=1 Tax=Amycolatopsis saalfeldensis TaxID=394193 RepID=A0A1H8YPD2_9PSEU|nr:glycosyltransferase [Amycolatopsis saalfeldensis]SEP53943.1 UDP:flavonoid glycosyltransferase YjiC, YdhE family [Amycolatopsis saalfeldensis]
MDVTTGARSPRIVVISPPFASHARPLATVAAALQATGSAQVSFACAPEFASLAGSLGVPFQPLVFGDNANTGIAERTRQDTAGSARLAEFLAATAEGAVHALLTQVRHRRADMLSSPEAVLGAIRALDERLRPDWYLVDQLAYSATLALHCLGARWATFCPGHPSYVLDGPDRFFGVPPYWPAAITPDPGGLRELRAAAAENDVLFTRLFAEFAAKHAPERPPPGRAFALTSSEAVLFNYPELPWLPALPSGPARIFAGHCTLGADALPGEWLARIARLTDGGHRRLVLVSFGTFLSARDDVLVTVARGVLRSPGLAVLLVAGDRVAAVRAALGPDDRLIVEDHVPQRALLPHAGLVVHHGGNNSFTECLAAGVPAVVLPFSSDQFAIAHDVERIPAGRVLDPAGLTPERVEEAVGSLLDPSGQTPGAGHHPAAAGSGPAVAAARLLEVRGSPQ